MAVAFSLAVLLLYIILAAQFESLVLPLIILAEIPISLSGAMMALGLTGYTLNLSSMMGMVIMLGIIINDSILKVDTIRRYVIEGIEKDTAVHQAGQDRLKAILMTSLTTILALTPVFFGTGMGVDLQVPLAVSVIGGLTVGTICSVYLVPILYRWMKR
jgi:multidrug efflux pump subunit AcrB